MRTFLKSFIEKRPAVYRIDSVGTMIDGEGAILRDYLLSHCFASLIRGYHECSPQLPLPHYQALRLSPSGINDILSNLFAYGVEPLRFFLGAHTTLCRYSSATAGRIINGV